MRCCVRFTPCAFETRLRSLATNLGHAECANNATGMAYTRGIPYAVRQIAKQAPSVSIYIDAAHGGWCGPPFRTRRHAA